VRTTYADKLKKFFYKSKKNLTGRVHPPYPLPQLQVCFLSFPIVFRDSHHPFTDPKRKARKPPYLYIYRILNKSIASQATTNPPSSSLITMQTLNVSSKTLRTSPISFFFIQTPKMQLRTFTRSSRPRHRRRQPQTRRAIVIYCKRTTIDGSGKETVTRLTYFVVDSVEALSKFGTDTWGVACVMTRGAGVAVVGRISGMSRVQFFFFCGDEFCFWF
jgi:hypothetical protein